MSIEVAVIPAAGRGTRMRPATRVVPKALLGVVDRPAIQYGVEEAARAGAKEAIVVVDLDTGHLISQHFTLEGPLPGLEDIRIRPAVQEEPLGLGHAVWEAREMVRDRPFFCILSDNIARPGHDVLPAMEKGSRDGEVSVVCLREYGDEYLEKYGFVIPASDVEDGYLDVSGAVEKPGKDRAPSNLGLVGRYIFTPEIFGILEDTKPGALDEIQLTDGIHELGRRGRLRGYVADTDLLDVGTPAGLLKATVELGLDQFGSDFQDFLDDLAGRVKPLELAQAEVLGSLRHFGAETVELADAAGRVLAADIQAREAIPPFPNSAMDGYAVQFEDVATAGAMLRVVGEIAAGSPSDATLQPGCAMKIMTGAAMPDGADTVVRVEDTERLDDVVKIQVAVAAGTSVRPAGDDIPKGATVFEKGVRLQSTHLAVMATVGASRPSVARRPRVALFSTGDELASPSAATLVPGQIRDSNRVMLRSLLSDVATVLDEGIIRDDPVALRAAFGRAAAGSDVIVASGGVSMGDHDHVRKILGDMGSIDFWRVAIKPAKPFAFGQIGGVPFFGLPGNPVSAFIAFEQLVRPALLEMQGALVHFRPLIRATVGAKIDSDPDRLEFVRVSLEIDQRGRLVALPSGGQGSHMLAALAAADGLARIPVGESGVKAGQGLDVEMFRNPETRSWNGG